MSRNVENSAVLQFDDFVVDLKGRVLSRNGEAVPLTPRVFDTLLAFVNRPGETVTKDELMSAIWPDSFVEEANLAQNVAVLRKALGENSREHRYIVTVPGKGYRFVPDVVGLAESDSAEDGRSEPTVAAPEPVREKVDKARSRSHVLWISILAALAAISVVGYFLLSRSTVPSTAAPSVARTRQITSFSGLDLYPAFGPNGNTLAFSSNKSGSFEIYVRQLVQ